MLKNIYNKNSVSEKIFFKQHARTTSFYKYKFDLWV
jgi:hypothetical protein